MSHPSLGRRALLQAAIAAPAAGTLAATTTTRAHAAAPAARAWSGSTPSTSSAT
ncbi:hypothetical protein [Nonomuraea candida]|uniref:hypothetical protein n=1 Tax=Nonomuraea candida TaxID=359159 RepID=UPI001470683C|nr:hypothetical protein [Nonomuraea candida]